MCGYFCEFRKNNFHVAINSAASSYHYIYMFMYIIIFIPLFNFYKTHIKRSFFIQLFYISFPKTSLYVLLCFIYSLLIICQLLTLPWYTFQRICKIQDTFNYIFFSYFTFILLLISLVCLSFVNLQTNCQFTVVPT